MLLPTLAALIEACLPTTSPAQLAVLDIDHKSVWRRFVDGASRRPESASHHAAGRIIATISYHFDCLNDLKGYVFSLPFMARDAAASSPEADIALPPTQCCVCSSNPLLLHCNSMLLLFLDILTSELLRLATNCCTSPLIA